MILYKTNPNNGLSCISVENLRIIIREITIYYYNGTGTEKRRKNYSTVILSSLNVPDRSRSVPDRSVPDRSVSVPVSFPFRSCAILVPFPFSFLIVHIPVNVPDNFHSRSFPFITFHGKITVPGPITRFQTSYDCFLYFISRKSTFHSYRKILSQKHFTF